MTKTRIIYFAVLVIACLILFWDKAVSTNSKTNPRPAAAAKTKTPPARTPQLVSKRTLPLRNDSPTRRHFNLSTESITPMISAKPRDLFTPSQQFRKALQTDSKKTDKIIAPAMQIKLTSVIMRQKRSCAVINGQVTFLGDYVGSYRLLKITADCVFLASDNRLLVVYFDKPPVFVR